MNAAGVKTDQAIYNDGNEDQAWDAVWDVATRVDSAGWTAEFRIPLSQMRYSRDRTHTFGIMVDRDVYRYNERYIWPLLRQSKTGFVSQFGSLHAVDDLEAPRRLEAMPYVVTKNASTITNNAFSQKSNVSVGGDVKYRLAPNLTLDATVNPDFGQVESDPSVLNLSAYESFFDERRPFFVAGRGLFRFDVNCSAVNCNGEGLYYSRRIGRTPQLAGIYGDTVPLQPTNHHGRRETSGAISEWSDHWVCSTPPPNARPVRATRHSTRRRTSECCGRRRIFAAATAASAQCSPPSTGVSIHGRPHTSPRDAWRGRA